MAIISNLIARLSVDHTAFDRGMRTSRTSLYGLTAESAKANKAMLGMAASAAKFIGVAGGIYAIKQSLTAAYREASQLETGMAKVSTMLDVGQMKGLAGFRKEIQQMSITYGEATGSLTQGLYDIIGSAIAPSKAMAVLEASTIAAKGGFTTTATTVKAVVGILNAYGMSADNAGRVTDILQATVQNGVISFEELAGHVGNVTGLAAVLGVDLEAVGASIATMTRAGISAEITITALRAILNTFMNPTESARKAAAELGLTLDETSIRGTGLVNVIDKLKGANAAQLEALMPNVRGLAGFAAMMKNVEGLQKDLTDIQNSNGKSMEMFGKVTETAAFQVARASEAFSRLKVALGDVFLGDVTAQMNGFADAVQNNSSGLDKLADAARRANHPIQTLMRSGRAWPGGKGKAATEGWSEVQGIYSGLGADAQAAFRKSFATRDVSLPGEEWEPAKKYRFDVEKMPIPEDYKSFWDRPSLSAERRTSAAMSDIEYAKRLAAAYARTPELQARVRADIERTRAAMEAAGMMTAIAPAVADVAPPKPAYTKEQTDYLGRVDQEIDELAFEASLLKMTNAERERAVLFRNLENEAAKVGLDFKGQEFEIQRRQLETALEYYRQQEKIAELGSVLGTGLADGFRAANQAIIEGRDAVESLRRVALDTLYNIQNVVIWKPLENVATEFFNSFLSNFAGGALGGLFSFGGGGGGGGSWADRAGDWQKQTEISSGRSYGVSHGGGIVGRGGLTRFASGSLLAGASRFHLGSDEVPSILQRGEKVTSVAGVAAERAMAGQMLAYLARLVAATERGQQITLTDYRPSAEQYIKSKDGAKQIAYQVQRNSPDNG